MNGWAGVEDPSSPQVLLQGMFAALVGADDARQHKGEGRGLKDMPRSLFAAHSGYDWPSQTVAVPLK